jgi:phage shock protein B
MDGFFHFLTAVITSGASIIGLLVIGGIILVGLRIARGGGAGGPTSEDTKTIQEIFLGLKQMEKRLDALEEILLDREGREGRGGGRC